MANPQWEDGFVKIATEIFEQLCRIRIPGEVGQVVHVVIRKTWGFNKKWDWIPLSQFCKLTGISKRNVVRALRKALSMSLVVKKDTPKGVSYCFNKNYDEWKPLSKKTTGCHKRQQRGVIKDNKRVSKKTPSINNTIDTSSIDTTAGEPPSESRGKKEKPKTDPNHANFVKFWHDKYEEYYGRKYHMEKGKDGILIGKILHFARNRRPSDNEDWKTELAGMVEMFFRTEDVGIAGHTIGTFYYRRHELREAWNE